MRFNIKVSAMHKVENWVYPNLGPECLGIDGKLDVQQTARELAKVGIFAGTEDTNGVIAYVSETLHQLDKIVGMWHEKCDPDRMNGPAACNTDRKIEDGEFVTIRVSVDFNKAHSLYKVGVDFVGNGITYRPTLEAAAKCAETVAVILKHIGDESAHGRWYFTAKSSPWFVKAAADLKREADEEAKAANTEGGAK